MFSGLIYSHTIGEGSVDPRAKTKQYPPPCLGSNIAAAEAAAVKSVLAANIFILFARERKEC